MHDEVAVLCRVDLPEDDGSDDVRLRTSLTVGVGKSGGEYRAAGF